MLHEAWCANLSIQTVHIVFHQAILSKNYEIVGSEQLGANYVLSEKRVCY